MGEGQLGSDEQAPSVSGTPGPVGSSGNTSRKDGLWKNNGVSTLAMEELGDRGQGGFADRGCWQVERTSLSPFQGGGNVRSTQPEFINWGLFMNLPKHSCPGDLEALPGFSSGDRSNCATEGVTG